MNPLLATRPGRVSRPFRAAATLLAAVLAVTVLSLVGGARPASAVTAAPEGIDVYHGNGVIDWGQVRAAGIDFAFIKTTEGNYYTDDQFSANYTGAYNAGIIRDAYHFARPDEPAAEQVDFFLSHGGGWSADNLTLPGMVDLEYNPYGETCYGLSQGDMVSWIHQFVDGYQAATGRYPIIYTATNWWNQCTGGSGDFASQTPLFLVDLDGGVEMPGGWGSFPWSFRQYDWHGSVAGIPSEVDRDVWNGDYAGLQRLANGG
ncbi:MAG: GH25 family lysozyme [Actinocatenispora sp.]